MTSYCRYGPPHRRVMDTAVAGNQFLLVVKNNKPEVPAACANWLESLVLTQMPFTSSAGSATVLRASGRMRR